MIISKKSENITRKDKEVLDIEFKAWYSVLKKRMRYAVCGMRYAVCGMCVEGEVYSHNRGGHTEVRKRSKRYGPQVSEWKRGIFIFKSFYQSVRMKGGNPFHTDKYFIKAVVNY